jgi:hypothetical protein
MLEAQFGPFEKGPDGTFVGASSQGFTMPAASILSNEEKANDDPTKTVESGDPTGAIVAVLAIAVLLLAVCGCRYKKLFCFKSKADDSDLEQGKKPVKADKLEKGLEDSKDDDGDEDEDAEDEDAEGAEGESD